MPRVARCREQPRCQIRVTTNVTANRSPATPSRDRKAVTTRTYRRLIERPIARDEASAVRAATLVERQFLASERCAPSDRRERGTEGARSERHIAALRPREGHTAPQPIDVARLRATDATGTTMMPRRGASSRGGYRTAQVVGERELAPGVDARSVAEGRTRDRARSAELQWLRSRRSGARSAAAHRVVRVEPVLLQAMPEGAVVDAEERRSLLLDAVGARQCGEQHGLLAACELIVEAQASPSSMAEGPGRARPPFAVGAAIPPRALFPRPRSRPANRRPRPPRPRRW
jgi:hypothetical protein